MACRTVGSTAVTAVADSWWATGSGRAGCDPEAGRFWLTADYAPELIADWTRRPDALTSLISTKRKRSDFTGCLDVADKSLDDTGSAAAATDFIVSAMMCGRK